MAAQMRSHKVVSSNELARVKVGPYTYSLQRDRFVYRSRDDQDYWYMWAANVTDRGWERFLKTHKVE
jgi:hypothetical protein